jgi:hypothetical protein
MAQNEYTQDDGSLAFLDIKPDPTSRQFNCKEISQQQLINVKFLHHGFY